MSCSCIKRGETECWGPCYDFCACRHCWNGWKTLKFRTRLHHRLQQLYWDLRGIDPSQ